MDSSWYKLELVFSNGLEKMVELQAASVIALFVFFICLFPLLWANCDNALSIQSRHCHTEH